MLSLRKEIVQCREHAERCAHKARPAVDDGTRANFLRLQQSWLKLAHSYERVQALAADSDVVGSRALGNA